MLQITPQLCVFNLFQIDQSKRPMVKPPLHTAVPVKYLAEMASKRQRAAAMIVEKPSNVIPNIFW